MRRKVKRRALLAFLSALTFVSCAQNQEVGSKARPFTMYFVPSIDSQAVAHTSDMVTKFVSDWVTEKAFGGTKKFYIASAIPANYIAVVEAFGTKKADFAAFNTFSYILAKDIKRYDVEVILTALRGADGINYKGAIIARVDSGIKTLEDIAGKRFAYVDPASTSGYILPMALFKSKGIIPSQTTFAQKHDNVVTMVYQKQVDAGAIYYSSPEVKTVNGKEVTEIMDARNRVKTQLPDIEEKVKIIAFTDSIPNEPWVVRGHLFEDAALNSRVKTAIRDALVAFTHTEEGAKMLHDYYSVTGVVASNDSLYDGIRKTVLEAGLDLEKETSKKK